MGKLSRLKPEEATQPQLKVGFILLPDFTLTPFSAFVDVLRLASDKGASSRQINCQWSIMGPSLKPIISSCGIEVRTSNHFIEPEEFDYIVICGGLLNKGKQADKETIDYLRNAAEKDVAMVGLCTGSLVMARAGLMNGYRCCVSWFHYHDLLAEFPSVKPITDKLFVIDRKRITCVGWIAVVDLAAFIIERHLGHRWAQKSMRISGVEHTRAGNAPQPPPLMEEGVADKYIRGAILLLEQNLVENLTSKEIADHLNISKRTLERHFRDNLGVSIKSYSCHLRLRYATWMLLNTGHSITYIANETGFADSAHMSRLFRKRFNTTPSLVRSNESVELMNEEFVM